MVLKKKVTAAVLAGAVATTAVVPMGLSVSAATTEDNNSITMSYKYGNAVYPGDQTSQYQVSIPANQNFSNEGETKDMTVTLETLDASGDFTDPGLGVTVQVYSANGYKMTAGGKTQTADYTLTYTGQRETQSGSVSATTGVLANLNSTTGAFEAGTSEQNADTIGILTPTKTSFTGVAELTKVPTTQDNTEYTDTLTYIVSETYNGENPVDYSNGTDYTGIDGTQVQ